ncbi:AmmeMemoRadiSam system protein A [Methylomonas sp. MK1]|uniref:AmmeMemoRadiSam system protein A n=1 Tax=Methylomonas sp. MK1 TaxID=1131552 RepID=UPI000363EA88|nr:AmmeMemoRadiSam system protein A [Methylomonas sp. MK1]
MSLTKTLQTRLLELARQSIAHGLQTGRPLPVDLESYPAELREICATFVTLELRGQLRGCIGMLEAVRPLAEDVAENAFAAAFRDRRFPPLAAEELADLDLHISVLSPAVAMKFASEADLIAQLRPGIDGIILQEDGRRGTFLPSVWDDLPDPAQFLQHLKQKAGLPAAYWSDTMQAYRYTTEMFG